MYTFDNQRMNNYAKEVSQTLYKVQSDCKNAYLQDIKIKEEENKFVITFEK